MARQMWLISDIGLQKKVSHGFQRDTTLRFSWLHAATSVGTDLRKASKNFGTIRSSRFQYLS